MEKSPDAFRTISEVSEWLNTPAHVLRFWESRFTQVKPVKRAGGRRYYRPSDMALLGGIKKLLHEDGMTIRGVQKILRSEGVRYVAALSPAIDDAPAPMMEDAEPEATGAQVLEFAAEAAQAKPGEDIVAGEYPEEEEEEIAAAPLEEASAAGTATGSETPAEAAAELAEVSAVPVGTPAATSPQPDLQARFEFDASPDHAALGRQEEAAQSAVPPRAGPPDLPELPSELDPAFAPRPSPFPLRDPRAVRARLAGEPARAAALYARLRDLRGRMDARPR